MERLDANAFTVTELSGEEMRSMKGGGLMDIALNLAIAGVKYFFMMGLREGRKTRANLL